MSLTASDVQSRAASYLGPVSDGEPAGTNASYDPRYEALRNDIAGLDSPTGGEVDWAQVQKQGQEILEKVSKDMLIACYTTFALFETERLEGLAVGFEMIRGMLEQYWDSMFPPLKRLRGRGNALDWLLARLETRLPAMDAGPGDRPGLDLAWDRYKAMTALARDKLEEHCPSTRPVDEAFQRLDLKLPKAPAEAPSSSNGASGPPQVDSGSNGQSGPAQVAPAAATAAPASASGGDGTLEQARDQVQEQAQVQGQVQEQAQGQVQERAQGQEQVQAQDQAREQPEPAAAEPEKDPVDALREQAQAWLEPISADAPVGADARYEPEFEEAKNEVAKLESASSEPPNWKTVETAADKVLKGKAKDVLMASYWAFARYKERGLAALPLGLAVVDGLVDRHAANMFPSRPRGRGNALAWLFGQLEVSLAQEQLKPSDRETVVALEKVVKSLVATVRDKLEDHAPSTRELTERLQRMMLAVPEPKPEPKPQHNPQPTPTPATQATPAPKPTPSATPAAPLPEATGDLENIEEVDKYLRNNGRSLAKVASMLRKANPKNEMAYRLQRIGSWMFLTDPPPADAGGKTKVPPFARRDMCDKLLANQKWEAVLEETESALGQSRFCVDLNRLSFQALEGLGSGTEAARNAIAGETAALLIRMPTLPDLTFANGAPFADDDTKKWIAEVVLVGKDGGTGGGGNEADEAFEEVRKLMKGGKAAEGMQLAMELVDASGPGRRRFSRRLALAEACLEAGQGLVARGMFAALEQELRDRNLVEWEPALAGRCLTGLVKAIRKTTNPKTPAYDGAQQAYERLCLIDPAAAVKLA